jgi:5-methylcytosine-specific restriction endonuclease McrA
MRQDGRLPKAFTDADVAALLGKWKLVVQSELPPTVRLCKVCGAYFKTRQSWVEQGRGTTCSIKCRDTLRWGERRVEKPKPPKTVAVRISKRPVRRIFLIDSSGVCASAGKYSPDKVYADQVCLECGERFSPALTNRRKYCSPRCARRVARRKDKARERGIVELEHVSLDLVLQRDNYQCWICKKKIDPTLDRSKDPMGATRDHIQPRHFGGVNAYWNVKAAHRSCNSSRGHRDEFQTAMPIAA